MHPGLFEVVGCRVNELEDKTREIEGWLRRLFRCYSDFMICLVAHLPNVVNPVFPLWGPCSLRGRGNLRNP
jgi:hypothetical protein